jgi:hypothetical protein
LAPGGYVATGAFTQPGFGDFQRGFACPSPTPCQGGNNSSVPNNILDFNVNLAGITEGSFIANASGFTFSADLFGPAPNNPTARLTFAVGAGSEPVPGILVPEPSTLTLFGVALSALALALLYRRRTFGSSY